MDNRRCIRQPLNFDPHRLRHAQAIRAMPALRVAAVAAFQVVNGREDDLRAFLVEVDAFDELLEFGLRFRQTSTLAPHRA